MQTAYLILTRFNLQFEADRHPGIQPEWLDERMQLFRQYTYPSVKGQTMQDFDWVVILDENTPTEYLKQLEQLKADCPQMQLRFAGYQADYNPLYAQIGAQYATQTLVSIRLDNDDQIAPDFLEQLGKQVETNSSDRIISFTHGAQLYTSAGEQYQVRWKKNHFVCFVENFGYITALGADHTQIPDGQIQPIATAEPMWTEVVHQHNICNGYNPDITYLSGNKRMLSKLRQDYWKKRIENRIKRLFH